MTMTTDTPVEPETPAESSKTLVVYFSGSGNTEAVAETIADTLNADIFQITPAEPYTSAVWIG